MQKLFLTLALPALICTQAASAQQLRPSLRDSLQKASDVMYQHGSYQFITVDAVLDGVLKLGEPYEFTYNDKQCNFKGDKLSKKQQQEYTKKFRACLRRGDMSENARINMRSDGVTIKGVFETAAAVTPDEPTVATTTADKPTKTTSATWITNPPPQKGLPVRDSARHLPDLLVLNMVEDKLVDTSEQINILYRPGFISVNGAQLNEQYSEKYIAMIEDVNKQSGSHPDMMSFSLSAHQHELRYPHPGPYTSAK